MSVITIQRDGWTAGIKTEGGQLCSLISPAGRQMMWNGDPAVWGKHSPFLFPVIGCVKNNQLSIGGKVYPMPKHGFRADIPMEVTELGDDYVRMTLRDNEETQAIYPFSFALHITHTLTGSGCTIEYTVENTGDTPLPFTIGFHPAFTVPCEEGAAFGDYRFTFDKPESARVIRQNEKGILTGDAHQELIDDRSFDLNYDEIYPVDTFLFPDVNSRGVTVTNRSTGRGIRVDFPKMPNIAVWTMGWKYAPYLCIEPWQGLPESLSENNTLEEKPGLVTLAPGRSYKTWMTVTELA